MKTINRLFTKILSVLVLTSLCALLGACGRNPTDAPNVCVFDEWYDGVAALENLKSTNIDVTRRLVQIDGAELDYDFGVEFVGVLVPCKDITLSLCYDDGHLVIYFIIICGIKTG